MYVVNRRPHRKRHMPAIIVTVLLMAGLGGASWVGYQALSPDTYISPAPEAQVTHVLGTQDEGREFLAGPVSLTLPEDWERFTPPEIPSGAYSWRNTAGNKGVRVITLYIDAALRDFAVNRVLIVEPQGDHMLVAGDVSDNCSEFNSEGRTADKGNGKTPARWRGVAFTCDSANYIRNVTGIAAADNPNGVTLTGPSGKHQLFLTYNDADSTPKFHIFTAAVESLRLH